MMNILGISAFVHDSAACLIMNGNIVSNVEEERLNRVKHTNAFPKLAIQYVLNKGGITLDNIDIVAFNWNPFRALVEELRRMTLMTPVGYIPFVLLADSPKSLKTVFASLWLKFFLSHATGEKYHGKIQWVPHHLCHAASAYYLSRFENADILVVDGSGEHTSTTVYNANKSKITKLWDAPIGHSLGLIYTLTTSFLGYKRLEEGKVMALASFGIKSKDNRFNAMIRALPNGKYRTHIFNTLFRFYVSSWFGKPRKKDHPILQSHMDLAANMQERIKEIIIHVLSSMREKGNSQNLCLSGGVFLNCDINRAILDSRIYENVFIPPFASDTGGAIGSALYAAFGQEREIFKPKNKLFKPYIGPAYTRNELKTMLDESGLKYTHPENLSQITARYLSENKIIGFFQGHAEAGPRALGNRSILANPCIPSIKDHLNRSVKFREWFRPFAPVATEQAAFEIFDVPNPIPDPYRYMLVTTTVRNEYREKIPGVVHIDGSARLQVVNREWTPQLYELLCEFGKITGFQVLINTSFNRHEPMVCSPQSAIHTFLNTKIDILVMNEFLIEKS